MVSASLVALGPEERGALAEVLISDYVEWLTARCPADSPSTVHARARVEIEADLAAAACAGDLFWAALASDGSTVGWVWVTCSEPGAPAEAAFLSQILVVSERRRQGYGRAMLSALETALTSLGFGELRLNVWDSNTAARELYAASGYELAYPLPGKQQLRKRLGDFGRDASP